MRYSGRLGGGTPTIFKYQIGASMPNAGVPVCISGASQEGVQLATTVAAVACMGITYDSATVLAAQQSDGSDPERQVAVCVNPDMIIRTKLSGGATADTALAEGTEDTGSTTGLLISTNIDYSSPSMDEGCLVCSYGANQGQVRRVTSLSTADAVPTLAFQNDIAVGDKFIVLPYGFTGKQGGHIMMVDKQYVELGTLLTQVNASVAIDANNVNFVPLRLILPADANKFTTQMLMDMMIYDHLYNPVA